MLNYINLVHLSTSCFFILHLKSLPHLDLDLPSGAFLSYLNIFFISFFLHVFQIFSPSLAFLFRHPYIWCRVKSSHSILTPLKVARCILRFCPVIFVLNLLHIVTKFTYNITSKQSRQLLVSSWGNLLSLCLCRRFVLSQRCFVGRLVSCAALYCGLTL